MSDCPETFEERRNRRIRQWHFEKIAGKNGDIAPIAGNDMRKNIADLESLRRMLYPEIEQGQRIDKSVEIIIRPGIQR